MSAILSLVGVPTLTKIDIDHLASTDIVDAVSLAPSHFGNLRPDGFVDDSHWSNIEDLLNLGIELHSLQGLLFQPWEPSCSVDRWLVQRIVSIANICAEFDVPSVVLGAPSFRADETLWTRVLQCLNDMVSEFEIDYYVENLCVSDIGKSCKPFGPLDLTAPEFRGLLALDTANALACPVHSHGSWLDGVSIGMIHASAANHKEVSTALEARTLSDFVTRVNRGCSMVWEFSGRSTEALVKSLAVSLDCVSEIAEREWLALE